MKHNLYDMMALDIYLSSLSDSEYDAIKDEIQSDAHSSMPPLLSWDIYSEGYTQQMDEAQREQDIIKVISMAKKLNWKNDINRIFDKEQFDAILVTDINQRIIWVNQGFTTMTGYAKSDAINKTPRFLQGEETSENTKRKITAKLKRNKPFTEVITNYRKNGTPYQCEVKIFPLYNDKTTHFIALEREVG
ncbi:PAS domain-containing protein [Winogradskyella sp. 3972H.M.0a.05]|uniref:PAS domain-containing protein n=1 Tax=Winogradskyella sp. 3972H.M.0a.05 TaxID=2950277 RepID=UPI0033969A42